MECRGFPQESLTPPRIEADKNFAYSYRGRFLSLSQATRKMTLSPLSRDDPNENFRPKFTILFLYLSDPAGFSDLSSERAMVSTTRA